MRTKAYIHLGYTELVPMMKVLNLIHTGKEEAPPIGKVPEDLLEAHFNLHRSQQFFVDIVRVEKDGSIIMKIVNG